jgi:hypothetical protein
MDQSPAALRVLKALDDRVDTTVRELLVSDVWRVLEFQPSNSRLVVSIMRELMLAEYWYRGDKSKAGSHMLSRLTRDGVNTFAVLAEPASHEAEHGLEALRDYFRLGGSQETAQVPASPASFAVSSVWSWMSALEDPLGYLGAEFLFSNFNARVSPEIRRLLISKGISTEKMELLCGSHRDCMDYARLLRATVCRTVDELPGCEEVLLRCFDYCRQVYPLPIWNEALERAIPKD